MKKVRIYDLAKELKPEAKKILEIARRMGVLSRLPHGSRPEGKPDMTDKPDKDKPEPRGEEGDDAK
jgi:Translation initiation factor IF-2, N-terminal region